MMEEKHVILVGTSNKKGISNVSSRSSFYVDNDKIYWYEFFKHKSFRNFTENNWASVSVIDYVRFSGYQLKGKINEIEEDKEFFAANSKISENLPKEHEEHIRDLIRENGVRIIQFTPIALYSSTPMFFEDSSGLLNSDADIDQSDEEFSMLDYV